VADESAVTTWATEARGIAQRFVRARRAGAALPAFPGPRPASLAQGYACQDAAMSLWPDRLVGWKVGRLPEPWRASLGAERLIGPIFAASCWRARDADDEVVFPVFVGGFAAVEAEFVLRLGRDAPPGRVDWDAASAAELVDTLILGIETAGSPLATINELGPAVVVSDFGNNAGLILGPEWRAWRELPEAELVAETFIDGRSVGQGGAAQVQPLEALAAALSVAARRGHPLRAGMLVSTGASTGIHDIRAGQSADCVFGRYGRVRCRAVPLVAGAA
jgi:2-keto-4-pentenoate hydratase